MIEIMRTLLLFLLITACTLSCNQENSEYKLKASMSGFQDGTLFEFLNLDKMEITDSVTIEDGYFEFDGLVEEPFSARIHTVDGKYLILWIESGTIEITGDYDKFSFSTIEGSKLNMVRAKYRTELGHLEARSDSLVQKMIQLMSSNSDDVSVEITELQSSIQKINEEIFDIRVQSIIKEEPSYFTIKELFFLRNDFTKDSLRQLLDLFPVQLQQTKYGEVIQTYIENIELDIGDTYIDIEGISLEGQSVRLSALEGNYVLLDFWASWCAPCRSENPNLVKAYQIFHDKGFEIFSFSIDSNINSWKGAVEKDSLTWTNVIDRNGSYSKMSALYEVRAIPASFLINPDGQVIARNLRGKALTNRLIMEFENHGL